MSANKIGLIEGTRWIPKAPGQWHCNEYGLMVSKYKHGPQDAQAEWVVTPDREIEFWPCRPLPTKELAIRLIFVLLDMPTGWSILFDEGGEHECRNTHRRAMDEFKRRRREGH